MSNVNEIYHRNIANQLLASQIKMIRNIENPDMFEMSYKVYMIYMMIFYMEEHVLVHTFNLETMSNHSIHLHYQWEILVMNFWKEALSKKEEVVLEKNKAEIYMIQWAK